MAGLTDLEDTIRSSVPGGNVGKPLMLALVALFASGALFRGSGSSATTASQPSPGLQPAQDEGAGGMLGGLGGLVDRLQKGGLGGLVSSWVGSGQNQPVSPAQLGPALGPDIIRTLAQRSGLSEEEVTSQLAQHLPGIVDKMTPAGRLPTSADLSRAL